MQHTQHIPQVSVVIPVYDVEAWLDACLDSVEAQTFGDFEAIVVNDGSTDGSEAVALRHAARDSRIRVVSTPNAGVARARERALAESRGRWIAFLDGDDLWEPDMLERLLAESRDYDIVCCDYKRICSAYEAPVRTVGREDLSGDGFLERMLSLSAPVSLWARLYRRELFEGLCHYPMRQGQDLLLNIQVGRRRPRVHYVDYVGYGYVQRPGSSIRRKPDLAYCELFAARVREILCGGDRPAQDDRTDFLLTINALWWYLGYISRGSNAWAGDSPFAARIRAGVAAHRRELLRYYTPAQLRMVRMDRWRALRPAVVAAAVLHRWSESLRRRFRHS